MARIDESAVVYLADKLIQGEARVWLETRFAPAFTRFAGDAGALAGARQRYADAEAILSAVESRIGPLEFANRPRASYENGSPRMTCCDRHLHLGLTESVCPVCLATIPAERCAEGGTVYLKKTCPEHGTTSTPVWRGLNSYLRWGQAPRELFQPPVCATEVKRGCPHDCGLCPDHRQQSCCVLLEVTSRCDLACPVCYASASRHGADASLAEIGGWLDTLAEAGGRVHIQLSGGEPTVRDDLPEIVALIRSRGFDFVQLNTNGVRIAREPDYLAALAKAGLDCVFLQFDGVTDDVYQRLRGAKLMRLKTQAIRNCGAAGIGVVLTPTLVPGVNVDQIGAIVDFAIAETPAVRAVHFQPVSYFGRCLTPPDDASRITLPEVMEALIAHSGGDDPAR